MDNEKAEQTRGSDSNATDDGRISGETAMEAGFILPKHSSRL